MSEPLSKDSIMECKRHGYRRPSFICRHLQYGERLGFNEPAEPPEADWPFQNAWCNECNKVLLEEGEWNDRSEGFAKVTIICEECFEEIRKRNSR
jgi:hypothetical protein